MNFNVAIVSVKGSDYRTPFRHMRKDDAINLINNFNLNEKVNIKMSNTTYYQKTEI